MNDTQLIEGYLLNQLSPADKLLLDAKLLLDNDLHEKIHWQQQAYALVKTHARQQLKQELEAVHTKLFTEKRFERFRNKIKQIFK